MDPKLSSIMVDDDILNFSLEDYEDKYHSSSSLPSSNLNRSFHEYVEEELEYVEEELEWLSNKEAFPAVEYGIFSNFNPNPSVTFDHQSPVSVLENSSNSTVSVLENSSNSSCNVNGKEKAFISCYGSLRVPINYPVRARSKTRRRRSGFAELTGEHCVWGNQKLKLKKTMKQEPTLPVSKGAKRASSTGRRCQHCGVDKTPQWRFGPTGPKTLCNACGVRYKSGRLFPEYRPANSPTYSPDLHSNSHRKVLEMRKQRS